MSAWRRTLSLRLPQPAAHKRSLKTRSLNAGAADDLCTAIIERYRDNVLASLSETIAELPPEADVETVASTTLEHFLKVLA
ncbi:MAG: hypothetical protein ACFN2Z_01270, partial [Oribacterium sp.]